MKEEGNNNAFFKIVNNELAVCLFGIAINIGGAQLAKLLKLPLFLDSIGTVLVAAIGGYLPGVIVGFCSNMINAMNDPANAYYTLLSVIPTGVILKNITKPSCWSSRCRSSVELWVRS